MKKMIFITLLLAAFIGIGQKGSAQEKKETNQKREQRNYYRTTLQVDSAKAEQVAQIQETYKKALAVVVADSSLTEGGRRSKIQLLIVEKNRKLRGLLNPSQQQKVIPTTEREATVPSKQQ
ncbi:MULTISPECIES: hypothetical protein [unclassified Pedobacter]|uniref:hypothetical protein n=1 Tax=unclassified Pedobacter TaxID=2628915 RepID=UPI00141F21FD|nr:MULTISPECIES: hypothetical protein [unclassified Pedobacter]NII83712.1 thiamine biosynthesis lipoprotein ApbE [Pedobacter sp. SG908]NMN37567.1 thiamine biosynthesis lipoprotein ApbE [Pedobacter sp. SG918]